MSQKLEQKKKQENIKDAKTIRLELADKIPDEYIALVKEAKSTIKQAAAKFVPKLEAALRKVGITGYNARCIIETDCDEIGWSVNTVRVLLSDELKNQNKGKGGKAAAIIRKENTEKRTIYKKFEVETTQRLAERFKEELKKKGKIRLDEDIDPTKIIFL